MKLPTQITLVLSSLLLGMQSVLASPGVEAARTLRPCTICPPCPTYPVCPPCVPGQPQCPPCPPLPSPCQCFTSLCSAPTSTRYTTAPPATATITFTPAPTTTYW
ncbi:hypothetical protein BKA70DRAFT_1277734 [Coprinopsis sp. MPI-PUGE-AT-0042]|nr:hypothetical protein BKA70DRAFT_1277734 [Coprinopsis sp. MPI-PUGE-AT-0042]